jgi:hypothetical protein
VATDGLEFADRMLKQLSLMTDALSDFIDEQKRENCDAPGSQLVPSRQPSEAWEAFINDHPELERKPLLFTDDELIRALDAAIELWSEHFGRRTSVWSSDVADELADVGLVPSRGFVLQELRPTHGDVVRVGQALARLTREGRVLRTNRSGESSRWALCGEKRDDA